MTFTSRDGRRAWRDHKAQPDESEGALRKDMLERILWPAPQVRERESARNGREAQLNGVAGMARRLMEEHGLTGWTLAFVEAKRRLGDCHFRNRVIRISRTHALEGSKEQIRDTVLHEIAHAIAGREAGHGPLWKVTARRIGATPRAKAYESQAKLRQR